MKENKRPNGIYTTNTTNSVSTIRIPDMPTRFVGSWNIGGLCVSLEKKPSWFKRKATTLLIGWIWKDN
jgi:hypothetical protein